MMHTSQTLYDQLNNTLLEINKQIEAVKRDVLNQLPVHRKPEADEVYRSKNRFGTFVLTDLLAAKAHCLSSMAALKAADINSKQPTPRR